MRSVNPPNQSNPKKPSQPKQTQPTQLTQPKLKLNPKKLIEKNMMANSATFKVQIIRFLIFVINL